MQRVKSQGDEASSRLADYSDSAGGAAAWRRTAVVPNPRRLIGDHYQPGGVTVREQTLASLAAAGTVTLA